VRALDPSIGWGNVEELLAALVELCHESNRLFILANTPKSRRPHIPPLRVPRPERPDGQTEHVHTRKRPASSEELARFFGGSVRYRPRMAALERPAGSGDPVTAPAGE
jgi:hypothetical protein